METTKRKTMTHKSSKTHSKPSKQAMVRQKKEIKGGHVRCFLIDGRKIVVDKKKGFDIVGGKAPNDTTAEEYLMGLFAEQYNLVTTKPFYVGTVTADGGNTSLFLSFVKSKEHTPDELFLDELVAELEKDKGVYKQVLVIALRLIKHSLNRKPQNLKTVKNFDVDISKELQSEFAAMGME